ncbi:MAG TPA: alcohol dehydrogenase catalytic domain-containing protein [Bryobacteraceae bacterium]|nr:alcohol dehydrogenase catalytic domain-containing protein [Bryobacteraceae bacterium]
MSMMAVVKTAPGVGNVTWMEVPEPECKPDGVKIEVRYSGICGTDLHVFYDRFRNFPPVILGHEFSGVVVETGAEVTRVKPGDRVTVLPSSAVVCGTCDYCVRGYYMFCAVRRGMGHGVNGSFAKYVAVRDDQVYKLPETMSFEEGALTEPFATAVQAIEDLTDFHVGDIVLLSGPGPIGLLCLSLLVAHHCKVIVAGADDCARLEIARAMGADVLVDVTKQDLAEVIRRETDGRGVDIAVNASGTAESVVASLAAVRPTGRLVQVGIAGRDVTLPYDQLLYKQISLFGSVGHSLKSWRRVMNILEQGKVNLSRVISHKLPISRWREAFDLCESKLGVKVLLHYDGMEL